VARGIRFPVADDPGMPADRRCTAGRGARHDSSSGIGKHSVVEVMPKTSIAQSTRAMCRDASWRNATLCESQFDASPRVGDEGPSPMKRNLARGIRRYPIGGPAPPKGVEWSFTQEGTER